MTHRRLLTGLGLRSARSRGGLGGGFTPPPSALIKLDRRFRLSKMWGKALAPARSMCRRTCARCGNDDADSAPFARLPLAGKYSYHFLLHSDSTLTQRKSENKAKVCYSDPVRRVTVSLFGNDMMTHQLRDRRDQPLPRRRQGYPRRVPVLVVQSGSPARSSRRC
jgi:hypothetical protein